MKAILFTVLSAISISCGSPEVEGGEDKPQDVTPPPKQEYPKEIMNQDSDGFYFHMWVKDEREERYATAIRERADFEFQNMQINGDSLLPPEEFFPTRPFSFKYVEPIINAPEGKLSKPVPSQLELKNHVDKVLAVMKSNCPVFFGEHQWPNLTVRWGQEIKNNVIGTVHNQFQWFYNLGEDPHFYEKEQMPLTIYAWNRLERSQVIESTRTTHQEKYGYSFSERKFPLKDSSFEFYYGDGPFFDDKLAHEIAHSIQLGWWFANGKRADLTKRFSESTAEWIKGLCYNNEITKEKFDDWYDKNTESYKKSGDSRIIQTWPFSEYTLKYAENLGHYRSVLPLGTLLGVLHSKEDVRADTKYLSEKTVEVWENMQADTIECYSEKYCGGLLFKKDYKRKPLVYKFSTFLNLFHEAIGGVPEDYRVAYLNLARIIAKKEK